MSSECFFVRSETRETSSTSSAFVMLPPLVDMQTPFRNSECGVRNQGEFGSRNWD